MKGGRERLFLSLLYFYFTCLTFSVLYRCSVFLDTKMCASPLTLSICRYSFAGHHLNLFTHVWNKNKNMRKPERIREEWERVIGRVRDLGTWKRGRGTEWKKKMYLKNMLCVIILLSDTYLVCICTLTNTCTVRDQWCHRQNTKQCGRIVTHALVCINTQQRRMHTHIETLKVKRKGK